MGATAAVHPAEQTVKAYGLGKLDDASSASVSQHLEECDSCQRRVAELSSDEFLGRLQQAKVMAEKAVSGWSPSAGSSTEGTSAPVIPPPPADTLPPELVDHPDYEIVRELGRGGMGVVYLANNKLMGRPEVLKVVGRHLIERPGVADRFLREIRSAAMLHHANIVAAYTAMRFGQSLVLAMEYVEGLDLAAKVKDQGPLPVAHACYFIHQAALGLQHAHERGMVHRDIKPANLILARDGKKAIVKVLDFGLAKVTSEGQTDSNLTREGQMLGTPDYIAPEQIRNAQSADIRADIYSLGCTFYYLLTGRPPFRGDHSWDVYQAHFSMEAGPLNLVRPEVPVELAAVVAKMMAKEPARRFQTPGEVARALTPFFKPPATRPVVGNTEVSQLGTPIAPIQTSGAGLSPTNPATGSPPAVPFPSWEQPDAATRANKKQAAPAEPETRWESLIEFKETEHSLKAVSAPVPTQPPRWLWPLALAGIMLFGLIGAGWVIVHVRTPEGDLVFEDLPDRAVVTVDDNRCKVEWPGGKGPATVTIPAGGHRIKVELDGAEVYGNEVKIAAGGRKWIKVRLEQKTAPAGGTGGSPSTVETPVSSGTLGSGVKPAAVTTNSIGMKLVLVPPGEFIMGMTPDELRDLREITERQGNLKFFDHRFRFAPAHRVMLTKSWFMGATEVTIGQFRKFVQATGYLTEAERYGFGNSARTTIDAKITAKMKTMNWRTPGYAVTDDSPVTQVTWNDGIALCNWLSEREKLKPCYERDAKGGWSLLATGEGYRLPTEAEWEYACRAGSTKEPPPRDGFAWLKEQAWFDLNQHGGAQPVAMKAPNAFGLYDMHGNVFEWCHDWFGDDYYPQSPPNDPEGPSRGGVRVQRGGCWNYGAIQCLSAFRSRCPPSERTNRKGFRVVRVTTTALSAAGGTGGSPAGVIAKPAQALVAKRILSDQSRRTREA